MKKQSKFADWLDEKILGWFQYKGEIKEPPEKIFREENKKKFEPHPKDPKLIKLKELILEFLKEFSGKTLEIHQVIIPLINKETKYEDIRVALNELLNEGKITVKSYAHLIVNTIQVP